MPTPASHDWNVSYSIIEFFERALRAHDKVSRFNRTRGIFFEIDLTNGELLNVLLVDEYALGLTALHRAITEFPGAGFIVTGANWNGYTKEAKEWGAKHDLGIFNLEEFLGAMNWAEPRKYNKKDGNGNPIYAYR